MSRSELALAVALAAAAIVSTAGDLAGRQTGANSAFLDRLVGDWSVVSETVLGPGQEPVRSESREVARRIGGWLVAEATGSARGNPITSIFTLGYDAARQAFVATWIDSMQAHMWSYSGTLDESGTVLTLDTEGPFMGDATRLARFRVIVDAQTPGLKIMRSSILGPDGEWFEFARTEFRRNESRGLGPGSHESRPLERDPGFLRFGAPGLP